MPARFIIQPSDKYFGFSFEGDNENLILFSRLYRSKSLCYAGIQELISTINSNSQVQKAEDQYGQFSFSIRNKKNVLIAQSTTFYASSTRDYAMKQIMREAASAGIVEETKTLTTQLKPSESVY